MPGNPCMSGFRPHGVVCVATSLQHRLRSRSRARDHLPTVAGTRPSDGATFMSGLTMTEPGQLPRAPGGCIRSPVISTYTPVPGHGQAQTTRFAAATHDNLPHWVWQSPYPQFRCTASCFWAVGDCFDVYFRIDRIVVTRPVFQADNPDQGARRRFIRCRIPARHRPSSQSSPSAW